MKKYWEINAPTIEESIKIAFKQIQKFTDKKNVLPVKLIQYEERSTEVAVGIVFDIGNSGTMNMEEWINNNRTTL